MDTKEITVVIPTYNEEKNVPLVYKRVKKIFGECLKKYNYKILFIDNCSNDNTRNIIKELALRDDNVQYIFNVKNFGFSRSTFYGLTQAEGDAAVLLFADMQDPPEIIVDFVKKWENGAKVVAGIKNQSKENKIMYAIRSIYYSFIKKITSIDHIEHFTGFGLYDKTVIDTFRKLDDPLPYLRGIVVELAPKCEVVYYKQDVRKYGKTSFNFNNLYDVAMLGITSYSKSLLRISTFIGFITAILSFVLSILTIIFKLFNLMDYPVGNAAIIIGVFFFGGVQLIFTGLLGEYISNINFRTMRRPLVVEESRYNFKSKRCDIT